MTFAVIEIRTFSTDVVLCVATKTIPDSALMPEVYKMLEFLTGGPVSTAQLDAALHEAHRFLLHRNPGLAAGWLIAQYSAERATEWFADKLEELGPAVALMPN